LFAGAQRVDRDRRLAAGLEDTLTELLGEGAAKVLATFERFEDANLEGEPHYYLSLLGTNPDRCGRRLGMGLLAATLERIDAEGAPAFLESSSLDNTPRYERLGFSVCGEFDLPERVTQMWRQPDVSTS
jgi:predicted N-acetyltransferase YhbS